MNKSREMKKEIKGFKENYIKPRIVFLIHSLNAGGAAKMLRYVSEACADDFNVTVISFYEKKSIEKSSKINYTLFDIKPNAIPIWRIKAIKQIRSFIKETKPDAICTFVSDNAVMARMATLGLKLKVISAERGDPNILNRMWERLVTWAYKKSDFCIFQLEDARDFFPDDVRKHSFVIPNPYIPVKTNIESTPERKKTIVSVGRFVQQKGYDVLISAFSEVYKKHPDYKLVLFGDGPLKTTYDEQVKTLGIDDAVVFPGYSDNPTESIMNEGIFVLSSRFEGIPNSLIEAMAVGVPTVSTDCPSGGPRFLSDDGKRSILVPINDSKRLENAINKIIETPQLAEELSRKGMEIREVLNEEIIRKQWIDTFKSMLVLTN